MYGLSKYYCERMVEGWGTTTGVTIQNLRIGHIYGPGEERFRKVIPETFRRILADDPIQVWGGGAELRAFIYVADAANAIITALHLEKSEGPINIAGDTAVTVRQLIDQMIEVSGKHLRVTNIPATGPARDLKFDTGRMKRLLGTGQIPLREGLKQEWLHMKGLYEQDLL
jgi:nucleoside-diphosphate-sugar epimerase